MELNRREIMTLIGNFSDEELDKRIEYYSQDKSAVVEGDWLTACRLMRGYRRGEVASSTLKAFVD